MRPDHTEYYNTFFLKYIIVLLVAFAGVLNSLSSFHPAYCVRNFPPFLAR